MAITVRHVGILGTHGFEAFGATQNVGNVPGTMWSSKETRMFDQTGGGADGDELYVTSPSFAHTDSDWITIGWYLYVANYDGNGTVDTAIFRGMSAGFNMDVGFLLTDSGSSGTMKSLKVFDTNNFQIGDMASGVFRNNSWHFVQIKYKHSSSSRIQVWVDRTLYIDETGVDLDSGAGDIKARFYLTKVRDPSPGPPLFSLRGGSSYMVTDDGAGIDDERTVFNPFVILGPYNDTSQGNISQFGQNLNVKGTQWDHIVDVPVVDSDVAEYQLDSDVFLSGEGGVTADDGTNAGPLGDSDVDGSLRIMSGLFRAKRSGTGMAIRFYGKYGTALPADVGIDRTQTIDFGALTTSFQNYMHSVVVTGSVVAGRYAQVGMKAGRISGVADTRAMLSGGAVYFLHEEPRLLIVDGKSQLIGA